MGALQGLSRGKRTVGGEHDIHQGIQRGGGGAPAASFGGGTSMAATVSCGQEAESAPGWGSATTKPRSSKTSPRRCQEAGTVTQSPTARAFTRSGARQPSYGRAGLGRGRVPAGDLSAATPRPAKRTTVAIGSLHRLRLLLRSAAEAASGSPSARRASRGRW